MYLHLGRGNVVRIEDIIAITDFERLTSFKKGQDYIDSFIEKGYIENPEEQFFPQSCVFVLKGIDDEEEIKESLEKINVTDDERFLKGGEFYLSDEELFEEESTKGRGNYERIIGKISESEINRVDLLVEQRFPGIKSHFNLYDAIYIETGETIEELFFDSEFFGGATLEEIEKILPEYNLYEKCRMVEAFRVHTTVEYGEEEAKAIEEREGISYVLGFGKIFLYGKKVYYPKKTRLYIYVSEFTPHTLYKRIKEEENLGYYVSEKD
ncbi:MAG: hypothetical protein J6A69_03450 [Clostridia bacterium]|nr:hypothetical protein [Clostridia bacterium]